MPLANTDLYHIAWVVDDLELSMKAFGSTGLQWATPTVRTVKVQTPTTAITEFSIFVTYSIHDPMHVELIQKCPGSPWDHVPNGGPHHLGWWSHDFKKSISDLVSDGHKLESWMVDADGQPARFAYFQNPLGQRIEIVDIAARPQLQAWWAGMQYPS